MVVRWFFVLACCFFAVLFSGVSFAQEGGAVGQEHICVPGLPLYQPAGARPFVCGDGWTASRGGGSCPHDEDYGALYNSCDSPLGWTLSNPNALNACYNEAPKVAGWRPLFGSCITTASFASQDYVPLNDYSINITGELSLTLSTDGDGEILFSLDADTGVTVVVDGGGGGSINPTALLSAEYLGSVWVPDAVVATISRDLGSVYAVPTTLPLSIYTALGDLSLRLYTAGAMTREQLTRHRKYYAHRYVSESQQFLSSLVTFPTTVTTVADMVNHFSNLPGF